MVAVLRFLATFAVVVATMTASIIGLEGAQNPVAERIVAVIGLLIIAMCGAFGILGLAIGVRQAIERRLENRRRRF